MANDQFAARKAGFVFLGLYVLLKACGKISILRIVVILIEPGALTKESVVAGPLVLLQQPESFLLLISSIVLTLFLIC